MPPEEQLGQEARELITRSGGELHELAGIGRVLAIDGDDVAEGIHSFDRLIAVLHEQACVNVYAYNLDAPRIGARLEWWRAGRPVRRVRLDPVTRESLIGRGELEAALAEGANRDALLALVTPQNVVGVFTDVNGEHPDNYRFLAEVQYALGSRLVKVTNDGRTIWDVFLENRFLGNTRVDVCSRVLKREAFRRWLAANVDPEQVTIALGIDWSEIHRFERAAPRWAADGYTIAAPLCERPYRDKDDAAQWLALEGIRRPALYDMGFAHANCGGGCVKAGIKQFTRRSLSTATGTSTGGRRVRSASAAALGRDDIAILRDRRGGTTTPLALRELRRRVEADPSAFADSDDESGCGVCFLEPQDQGERQAAA
jgi:3'-phosphoadenosine 5'-phosphosulfate sulfotransferase (PAPS reductase)/FAD synthetase